MYLSENLRAARQSRKLTQEAVAELLGVSTQAVSRWECGNVCPDISLLPAIANLYEISLDELFGMEKLRPEACLHGYFDRSCTYRRAGELEKSESELRAGLRLFPGEHALMSELALTLSLIGKCTTEAIELSERVLAQSKNSKLRATTAANLVYLYLRTGEREKAKKLASTLPHIRECRELISIDCADNRTSALKSAVHETLRTLTELIDSLTESQIPPKMLANGLECSLSDGEMLEIIAKFLVYEKN